MSTISTSPDKDYVDTIETFSEKNASKYTKMEEKSLQYNRLSCQ